MTERKHDERNIEIKCPHLIICEGFDACRYMIYFLQALIKDDPRYEDFQVEDGKGINDLPTVIKMLPDLPRFNTVKSITIIRDSENSPSGASQSIKSAFRNGDFAVPPAPCVVALPMENNHNVRTGYALFPALNSDKATGTLEDLCLNTLADPNRDIKLSIVDDAVQASIEQIGALMRPHKNRLHTYLSLTNAFVGLKIGESAKANAFDFHCDEVKPLKMLLKAMLNDA